MPADAVHVVAVAGVEDRIVAVAAQREHAGQRLGVRAEPDVVFVRTREPEEGHRHINEGRVDRVDRLVVEPEAPEQAWRVVLDDDVRDLDELVGDALPVLAGEVGGHRRLIAPQTVVHRVAVPRLVLGVEIGVGAAEEAHLFSDLLGLWPGHEAARVGDVVLQRFHANDLGAQVGQHHDGVRPRPHEAQVQHPDAGQRQPSHQIAPSARSRPSSSSENPSSPR